MDYHRAFPYYPMYPEYRNWDQMSENRIVEDLEYLQQMYPAYAKRYQVRVKEILDKMDYDRSMIYDQYPDRWQLERLVRSIVAILKREEMEANPGQEADDTKWAWIQELVTLLLYYEILKRRQKRKNNSYF